MGVGFVQDYLGRGVPGVEIPPAALLIKAAWPRLAMTLIDPQAESEFELIQQLVAAVRQVGIAVNEEIARGQVKKIAAAGPAGGAPC